MYIINIRTVYHNIPTSEQYFSILLFFFVPYTLTVHRMIDYVLKSQEEKVKNTSNVSVLLCVFFIFMLIDSTPTYLLRNFCVLDITKYF